MSVIKSISVGGGRDLDATAWMGDWVTATAYRKNAQVKHNSDLFTCSVAHTSAAGTEPGVGVSWATKWVKQVDALTTSELLVISSHIADATKHREINDSATTSTTQLWSANKANTAITAGMAGVFTFENPVIDKDLATPPSPVEGARYIVAGSATDAWLGHETDIAQYTTDAWVFTAATAGMACHVTDEALLYLFNGTIWQPVDSYVVATSEPGEVDYDAGTVGVSTKLALEDHNHDLGDHAHEDADITILSSVGQNYTLDDMLKLESAGRISGGIITEGTDGVDISELHCFLKTTEADIAPLKYVVIPAGNIPSTDLTANALNYICADYNDGTPQFFATTSRTSILINTHIILGRCYIEGDDQDIFNGGINLSNTARTHHDRLVMRGFERMSGAVLSEVGTRYLNLTAGVFYFGSNRIDISAVNTSTTGTYTRYLRDGNGGWTRVEDLTQASNNVYDDGSGTPAAIPEGYYAARWVYVCLDGDLYICDGQNYFTLAEAKAAQQPASLPDYIVKNTKLVAKYIVSPEETHFVLIISGYESALFGTTAPTSHQGLAGLQGGEHAEYYHLTNTQHTALTTNIAETVQDIAGAMVDGGTETGLSLTYSDETGKISGAVTYGTTSDTACEGDDVRLSDARTPSSHTIASHTTSGAADGKILTASSATEFGWEDPAPTWTQVTSKPETFAPVVGTGAADAAAGNHVHAYSTLTGTPTTFAPIVGTGAADAAAGNHTHAYSALSSIPLTFAPSSHTHPSTELTDYVAPTTWIPTVVWSGAAPTYTAVARYTKIGNMVTFWLAITGNDGDGRKLTSVTLPLEPKNVGMTISCAGQQAAPTTRSDPYAYIVANTNDAASKLLQFYTALTFGNNLAFNMNVTGTYEVA